MKITGICETVSEDVPWRAYAVRDSHPMQELLQRVFCADGSVGDW